MRDSRRVEEWNVAVAVAHPLVLLPIVVVASFGLWRGWGVLGVWRIVLLLNRVVLVRTDASCVRQMGYLAIFFAFFLPSYLRL